jgi:fused signal recognition particle receptor
VVEEGSERYPDLPEQARANVGAQTRNYQAKVARSRAKLAAQQRAYDQAEDALVDTMIDEAAAADDPLAYRPEPLGPVRDDYVPDDITEELVQAEADAEAEVQAQADEEARAEAEAEAREAARRRGLAEISPARELQGTTFHRLSSR